jgi:hypothetical protein
VVKEMKLETYLYINKNGVVVDISNDGSAEPKYRTFCLKVVANIPDEYFESPIFGISIEVPPSDSKTGGVQKWLTPEVEKLKEPEKKEKTSGDIPFIVEKLPF